MARIKPTSEHSAFGSAAVTRSASESRRDREGCEDWRSPDILR
jgi:hypothetical protein